MQAARRELWEETGHDLIVPAEVIYKHAFRNVLPTGENVLSRDYYFKVNVSDENIDVSNWTLEESAVTAEYRWLSLDELLSGELALKPLELVQIVKDVIRI